MKANRKAAGFEGAPNEELRPCLLAKYEQTGNALFKAEMLKWDSCAFQNRNFMMLCSSTGMPGMHSCSHTHTHTHTQREKPKALSHDKQQLKTEIYGVTPANANRR